LNERLELLRSNVSLVEVDLLLGGQRLPTDRPLKPSTDYCVFVVRRGKRPFAEVFEWELARRLPRIPIPLANGDPDALLDLQSCLDVVYDKTGYDYSLRYERTLNVSVRPDDARWIEQRLAARKSG
jgi:hypothetical protein